MISFTGLSPSMAGCPKTVLLSWLFVTPPHVLRHACGSYNTPATAPQCCNVGRGLGSSAFAHRYLQNLFWCLFLRVIRCFNSPGIASLTGSLRFAQRGSPIRKSTDQCLFTTPRRLSQQTTSFFACRCPGIPRTPLLTWPYYLTEMLSHPHPRGSNPSVTTPYGTRFSSYGTPLTHS